MLKTYSDFVHSRLSDPSAYTSTLIKRLWELGDSAEVSMLLTGACGLCSESGEFMEIVKKACFQGKPLDEANTRHLKRELGDIIFYWVTACRALGFDPEEVIQENQAKLEARYPNGFEVARSEVRQAGDL